MDESTMLELIKKGCKELSNLQIADDKYSRYYAENAACIVAFKSRTRLYKTTLLEKDETDTNLELAQSKAKVYLYAVFDGYDKIQIFNITKLKAADYDFQWKWVDVPWSGEVSSKHTGEIDWSEALRTVKLKRNDNMKKKDVDSIKNYNTPSTFDPYDMGI